MSPPNEDYFPGSPQFTKELEKQASLLRRIGSGLSEFGRRAKSVGFDRGFTALFAPFDVMTASQGLGGIAEVHKGYAEFQLGSYGVQRLGQGLQSRVAVMKQLESSSKAVTTALDKLSRGMITLGKAGTEWDALKNYNMALEGLERTGTKTGIALARAFAPLRVVFNPLVGAATIAITAIDDLNKKTIEARKEMEAYGKSAKAVFGTSQIASGMNLSRILGTSTATALGTMTQVGLAGFSARDSQKVIEIANAVSRQQGKEIGQAINEQITRLTQLTIGMTRAEKGRYLEREAVLSGSMLENLRTRGRTTFGREWERAGLGAEEGRRLMRTSLQASLGLDVFRPGLLTRAGRAISENVSLRVGELQSGISNLITLPVRAYGAIQKAFIRDQAEIDLERSRRVTAPEQEIAPRKSGYLLRALPFGAILYGAYSLRTRKPSDLATARVLESQAKETLAVLNKGEAEERLSKIQADIQMNQDRLRVVRAREEIDKAKKALNAPDLSREQTAIQMGIIKRNRAIVEAPGAQAVLSKFREEILSQSEDPFALLLPPGVEVGLPSAAEVERKVIALKEKAQEEKYKIEEEQYKIYQELIRQGRKYTPDQEARIEREARESLRESIREKYTKLRHAEGKRARISEIMPALRARAEHGGEADKRELAEAQQDLAKVTREIEGPVELIRRSEKAIAELGTKIESLTDEKEIKTAQEELAKEYTKLQSLVVQGLKGQLSELSELFLKAHAETLSSRELKVSQQQTRLNVQSMAAQGFLSPADQKRLQPLLAGELTPIHQEAISKTLAVAQAERQTKLMQIQTEMIPVERERAEKVAAVDLGFLKRKGITPLATKADMGALDPVLRQAAQSITEMQKSIYDQDIEALRHYAQLRLNIIKTHYDNAIALEEGKLYGKERKLGPAIGYGQQLMGLAGQELGVYSRQFGMEEGLIAEKRQKAALEQGRKELMLSLVRGAVPIYAIPGALRQQKEAEQDFHRRKIFQMQQEIRQFKLGRGTLDELYNQGVSMKELEQTEGGLGLLTQAAEMMSPLYTRRGKGKYIQGIQLGFIQKQRGLAAKRYVGEERTRKKEMRSMQEQVSALEEMYAKAPEDSRLMADLAAAYKAAGATAGSMGNLGLQRKYAEKEKEIVAQLPPEFAKDYADKQSQMAAALQASYKELVAIRKILEGGKGQIIKESRKTPRSDQAAASESPAARKKGAIPTSSGLSRHLDRGEPPDNSSYEPFPQFSPPGPANLPAPTSSFNVAPDSSQWSLGSRGTTLPADSDYDWNKYYSNVYPAPIKSDREARPDAQLAVKRKGKEQGKALGTPATRTGVSSKALPSWTKGLPSWIKDDLPYLLSLSPSELKKELDKRDPYSFKKVFPGKSIQSLLQNNLITPNGGFTKEGWQEAKGDMWRKASEKAHASKSKSRVANKGVALGTFGLGKAKKPEWERKAEERDLEQIARRATGIWENIEPELFGIDIGENITDEEGNIIRKKGKGIPKEEVRGTSTGVKAPPDKYATQVRRPEPPQRGEKSSADTMKQAADIMLKAATTPLKVTVNGKDVPANSGRGSY